MKTTDTTVTALVETDNFTSASVDFDKFSQFWSKDSEALKAESLKTYEAIQFEIEKVETALKPKQTARSKLSLKALSTHVEKFIR